MSKDAKQCGVRGCERPAKQRGICHACYQYMTAHKGERGNDRLEAIRTARLPSTTTGKPEPQRPDPPETWDGNVEADVPADEDRADRAARTVADDESRTELDVTIATACELATALKLEHVVDGDSHYIVNPHNGRAAQIAPTGLIYAVRREWRKVHD